MESGEEDAAYEMKRKSDNIRSKIGLNYSILFVKGH
jgi:hypothetical protein